MNRSDKGIMGIGTLIIFIAIIIVAAVAAAILISSTGTFGTKALATQKGTDEEVTTGIVYASVIGRNGSDSTLETLDVMARLRTGSDPMTFNTTVITIDTVTNSQLMTFSGTNTTTAGKYYVNYLQEGVSHLDNYLTLGDTAIITINLEEVVLEQTPVTIQIIPKVGGISRMTVTTPSAMVHYRVFLFP